MIYSQVAWPSDSKKGVRIHSVDERERESGRAVDRMKEDETRMNKREKGRREKVKKDSLWIVRVGVSLMFLVSCVRGHRTDSSVSPAFKLPLDGRAHFRAWLNIY